MDLKSFREDKLKIKSQTAFAELLGESQYTISRWEKKPEELSVDNIMKIMLKTGASFEELTGWKKPISEALQVKDTWSTVEVIKKMLQTTIAGVNAREDIIEEHKEAYLQGLPLFLRKLTKPRVALVGRSDTGKSTFINTLLGAERMPTGWTPTTSIAIYIKDKSDRPAFIDEDVWIFKRDNGAETVWDISCLEDESVCREWKLAAGGVERLVEFGTRHGESAHQSAGSAVVFLDAPILKICDLIDLPGYGTDENMDDEITFGTTRQADVLIYLSNANGFMRIEDINYLKRNMRELPIWEQHDGKGLDLLENLFIVASQAHTVDGGDLDSLGQVMTVGCANLDKTLPEQYWKKRQEISGYIVDSYNGALSKRFFTFSTDAPHLRSDLNKALVSVLERLSGLTYQYIWEQMKEYIHIQLGRIAIDQDNYKMEQAELWNRTKDIGIKEPARKANINEARTNILKRMFELEEMSLDEFHHFTEKYYTPEATATTMIERETPSTRDGVAQFGSYWVSNVELKCESILEENFRKLKPLLDEYLDHYRAENTGFTEDTSFDFYRKSWKRSNYCCTEEVVVDTPRKGLFGAMGLPVLAASFGAVGLIVGSAIAANSANSNLYSNKWEQAATKKIVRTYYEQSGPQMFQDEISKFWSGLREEFTNRADDLEMQWTKYILNLEERCSLQSKDDVEDIIQSFRLIEVFLQKMQMIK